MCPVIRVRLCSIGWSLTIWRRFWPRSTPIRTPEGYPPLWNGNFMTICRVASWRMAFCGGAVTLAPRSCSWPSAASGGGVRLSAQVGLGNDDDIERLLELLVKQLRLVETGLDVPLYRGLFEVVPREVVVIDLVAILAMGPSPGIGSGVREVQGRIALQLGNEVQVALPGHVQGLVMAEVDIEDQGGLWDHYRAQLEQVV